MLKVIWGLPAESPKRVSRTVQTLFRTGGNCLKRGFAPCKRLFWESHPGGPKTPFAPSLSTFGHFGCFDSCTRVSFSVPNLAICLFLAQLQQMKLFWWESVVVRAAAKEFAGQFASPFVHEPLQGSGQERHLDVTSQRLPQDTCFLSVTELSPKYPRHKAT